MFNEIGKLFIASGLPVPEKSAIKLLEWNLLRQTLTNLNINCVLDVGANRGQYATNLRKIGYKGIIISFEPIQEEFMKLSARFYSDKFWRGYNLALGNDDATRTFNVAIDSSEMSSFLKPLDSNWNVRSEQVTLKRLDGLFFDVIESLPVPGPHRIFLKMDTQGYDVEVIKGAEKSLDSIVGLQSELSITPIYADMPSYLETLAYYHKLGFGLLGLSEAARSSAGHLVEMNCIMARV